MENGRKGYEFGKMLKAFCARCVHVGLLFFVLWLCDVDGLIGKLGIIDEYYSLFKFIIGDRNKVQSAI